MSRDDLRDTGEDAAARFLERRGLEVLARNWRLKMGEIDIIAKEGPILVFVEVKTRRTADFVDPSVAVDFRKQRKLRRLAEAYIAIERPDFERCRFDVVSVVHDGLSRLRYIPDAFA